MAKAKGRVTIDGDRCKGCELCTRVCPVHIVVMVTDMDKCIGCANCATMCPDTVIKVEREFN